MGVVLLKQFQFEYKTYEQFKKELVKIKQWKSSHIISNIVLQIYSVELENSIFLKIFKTIEELLPDAMYLGCSTNGNILDGKISSSDIIIVCTIFEYPSTKVKLLQYDLNSTNSVEVIDRLIEEVNKNSWVKAIEFLVTMRGRSMTDFCNRISEVKEGVEIFGGGAFAPDINSHKVCIYSNSKGYSNDGVVFMLLGGEDLHINSTHITGWKPLGRRFKVTSVEGCVLKELDNRPAYDAYYKYLNVNYPRLRFAKRRGLPAS